MGWKAQQYDKRKKQLIPKKKEVPPKKHLVRSQRLTTASYARRQPAARYLKKEPRNDHHVPPRHPDPTPKIIPNLRRSHLDAYRLLFGSSRSIEECIDILKHDWWPAPAGMPIVMPINKKYHAAYHALFGSAPSLEACIYLLTRDWWNVKRT